MKPLLALLLGLLCGCSTAWAIESRRTSINPDGTIDPPQVRRGYGLDVIRADGNGQTVAIFVIGSFDEVQLQRDFDTAVEIYNRSARAEGVAPLPPQKLDILYPAGRSDASISAIWQLEAAIDTQMVHLVAPRARIKVVSVPPTGSARLAGLRTAADSGASVVSMSFGIPFPSWTPTDVASWESVFRAHPGVTFVAGTGDRGTNPDPNTGRFRVAYPASSPQVVAVGAVDEDFSPNPRGWTATAPGTGPADPQGLSSGGGRSDAFDRPAWQTGVTLGDGGRMIPDLSMAGGMAHPVRVVVGGKQEYHGGTSLAAPLFAGIVALANQGRGASLGDVHRAIYEPYRDGRYRDVYRDPRSGVNTFPFGSEKAGYAARPGFDMVTGLGVPRVAALLRSLALDVGRCATGRAGSCASPSDGTATP